MPAVTSKDGTKIAYTRSGDGPVVILVGGALQHKSDHLMGRLAPLLAKDFTVVSYDRRGREDSSDTKPYTIEREVEDLEAIIKDVGGPACVFGNSSGGTLALMAATKLPGITKLAVYEAPYVPEQQLGNAAEYLAQLKKLITANQPGRAVKLFLKRIGMPTPMITIMSVTPMWPKLKALAPTLVYDALIVDDGTVPKQLKEIAAPILVLSGNSARMQQAAKAVSEVLPNAQRQVLEGQTHDVKPGALAPALIEFFKEGE